MGSDDNSDHLNRNLTRSDLNQPIHRVERYTSMLNELGTTQNMLERQIQHLTSVIERLRQSRNSMEASFSHGETRVDDGLRSLADSSNPERRKGYKRDSSHLVEKALETNSEVKKPDTDDEGSFFECSICLELAKEPVLTCCGHLFCWACFYQVSNVGSSSKECPVCKGEVSDSNVTPIYGNGDSKGIRMTESGLLIPPRPKGRRVESVRQEQSLLSRTPISDIHRRIRVRINPTGDGQATQQTGDRIRVRINSTSDGQATQQTGDWIRIRINPTGDGQTSQQTGERHRVRRYRALRVVSSALSNAERLFDELESVGNNQMVPAPLDVGSDLPTPPTSSDVLRLGLDHMLWNMHGPRRRLN